jgi:sulfite exporter TauE/SafE
MPPLKGVAALKGALGVLLHRRSLLAVYSLGVLNGFLPCGLVYAAAAGALAAGNVLDGGAAMLAFGCGTVPLMYAIGLLGRNIQLTVRFRLQRLFPVCLGVVGTLLVLRGLSLGIPYLSPTLGGVHPHCH